MRHTKEIATSLQLSKCTKLTALLGGIVAFSLCSLPAFGFTNSKGTLGLMPTEDWAIPLSDREIAQMRGGFNGTAFNVFFSGFIEHLQGQQTAGNFTVIPRNANSVPTTSPVPPPSFGIHNGQVSVSSSIGNFNGGTGIFQIAQVPGNNNTVNNNLFVKIDVFNGVTPPVPNLSSLLSNSQ